MRLEEFNFNNENCRYCYGRLLLVKNLGNFISCGKFSDTIDESIESGYLRLAICEICGLVQLEENFNQTLLYNNHYGYASALNSSMVSHLSEIAKDLYNHTDKNKKQIKHLDIGSNDATLINLTRKYFESQGDWKLQQLGVDPTAGIYELNYYKSRILVDFFSLELTKRLNEKFDLISSIAMLYDLPHPIDFFLGIKNVLDPSGIWISEQSYIFSMTDKNAFDTICHEHLEYYSVSDINNLCKASELELFDISFNDTNGGSFRFYVQHLGGKNKISPKLKKILVNELTMNKPEELHLMFDRVEEIKIITLNFLEDCKINGRVVHGYGASTKGNTLLQYFGISEKELPFIAEVNQTKFGKYTPGSRIPIISEEESRSKKPYAYLVLPWHFMDSILLREKEFIKDTGTKFCFPLPYWRMF